MIIVTSLLRHMTSPFHVMFLEGHIFRSAILTPGFIVIASMLSMLRGKRLKSSPVPAS